METMNSLFLSQSYYDAWDDYIRSLNKANFARWDYVILTASNEQQAEGFRMQLEERIQAGLLPKHTKFSVIPDPEGKRVGSGGATLNVMRYLAEQEGTIDFSGMRILVIHSGGDSKRVPQYSALGKIFSPVPRKLPDGRASTLFDEFMIGMSGVAGRIREGMLLLSGDVLLLFNPLQIDFSGRGASAISFKEPVSTGKNHGVYQVGEDGTVVQFLHKQTEEMLKQCGAVNEQGFVDIDTGAVIFSIEMLHALFTLITDNGKICDEKFHAYVNEEVRLSLYGDFLYPMAEESSLEAFYREKPEGNFCDALTKARTAVWDVLRPYRITVQRLSPAKFVHFGTTREILSMMTLGVQEYQHLGWESCTNSSVAKKAAAYNSVLSSQAECGKDCYLEVSYVHQNARIGDRVLLSYIDIENKTIPSDVVLHGLKQKDGKFVARIWGRNDNPKETLEEGATLFGIPLSDILSKNKIQIQELWHEKPHTLWTAELYPSCATISEAVDAALQLYQLFSEEDSKEQLVLWRTSKRKSLCSGFQEASSEALIAWEKRMQELVCMKQLEEFIDSNGNVNEVHTIFNSRALSNIQKEWLERQLSQSSVWKQIRLNYYIGRAIGGSEGELYIDRCFERIKSCVLEQRFLKFTTETAYRICREEHQECLPLRVNWGGGWSDTPPYCNEQGGTVLNAAITLNGMLPVQVTLRRLEEKKVVFDSRDMNLHGEFYKIEELQSYGDPYDPFALQKAALLAMGVIPMQGGTLEEVLDKLGGGIFLNTEVVGVPKGSGLGTSSILAGACIKALYGFFGATYTEAELYDRVLCVEQLMSTGGGWQDQVGGLTNGIKYITSKAGLQQKLNVQHLTLEEETLRELNERFALIYTGQRRLARNLLRDVVGRYIGGVPEAVEALTEIQKKAVLMRFELERGNIDGFAELLNEHWELSKQLDSGSTNTCIDQILHAVEPFVDGRMICGAGGGGFLQVIMKRGVTREQLSERLHEVFQDSGVEVWQSEIL